MTWRERENDGAADCALDCEDRIRPSEAAISPFCVCWNEQKNERHTGRGPVPLNFTSL